MDNVFWVVIAASVMIALGGIVLYIGGDSLSTSIEGANDTGDEAVCSFQIRECEAGRIDYNELDNDCQDDVSSCPP